MDIISFYESDRREFRSEDSLMMSMYDKKKLKLDLTTKVKKQDNNNAILTSPDLKLLKLDSPELERIILATAGSATPTPKQYRRGKGASDLTVREQQEQYVRGFEDAFNKIQQQAAATTVSNAAITSTVSNIISNNNNNIVNTVQDTEMGLNGELFPVNTIAPTVNETQFPSTTLVNTTISFGTISTQDLGFESFGNNINRTRIVEPTKSTVDIVSSTGPHIEADDMTAAQLLVEPVSAPIITNTVNLRLNVSEPSNSSSVSSPSATTSSQLSTVPIDLQKQEVVKSERKKHRNRVAASKCRKRKLERESNLQETVDKLKARHHELSEIAATLRQQVCELKLKVMDHVKSGCEVRITQPLQT